MTTALDIAQSVVDELGLPAVTFITNNTNTSIRQLMALVNRAGDELYQAHQWTGSQQDHIINIGPPIETTGDITAGSDIVTNIPDTSGIVAKYFAVAGNYIIVSARVVEIIDANTVRIDEPATNSQPAAPLVFCRDTFDLPADFSWFLNRTMWDRTNRWELIGPMTPQQDEYNRSGVVTTGPRRRWRQIGLQPTCWRLWPPPSDPGSFPATLVFEYVSKYWVLSADGVRKSKMTLDTDAPIIDAQGIILSAKWRLWQAKGFEYGAMQAEYLDYVSRLAARNGGGSDLSLAKPMQSSILITPESVPDGFWPGPGND